MTLLYACCPSVFVVCFLLCFPLEMVLRAFELSLNTRGQVWQQRQAAIVGGGMQFFCAYIISSILTVVMLQVYVAGWSTAHVSSGTGGEQTDFRRRDALAAVLEDHESVDLGIHFLPLLFVLPLWCNHNLSFPCPNVTCDCRCC